MWLVKPVRFFHSLGNSTPHYLRRQFQYLAIAWGMNWSPEPERVLTWRPVQGKMFFSSRHLFCRLVERGRHAHI